ncbi:MAG: hypothetical protein KDD69_05085 [Bdellovibrionales bacterium]|nr:hypothetical protein [Bdellovibrionales bacterium]
MKDDIARMGDTQREVVVALESLGLTHAEIAVYQASLALGPRPASVIAERAGLKRSHTYNILSSLQKKGIVQEIIKNSVRHFSCCQPTALVGMINNQLEDLTVKKKKLERVVPLLENLRGPLSKKPKVRFYQGQQGIQEIWEEILRTPNEAMYSIVDLEFSWSRDEEMRHWLKSFIQRREDKNIWWYAIAVRSPTCDRELAKRSARRRHVKVIEGLRLPAEITVFGTKAALTSTKEEMVGVVIENEPIVDTLRAIHQYLWHSLPDYEITDAAESLASSPPAE